jgi:hypothetical protein
MLNTVAADTLSLRITSSIVLSEQGHRLQPPSVGPSLFGE